MGAMIAYWIGSDMKVLNQPKKFKICDQLLAPTLNQVDELIRRA